MNQGSVMSMVYKQAFHPLSKLTTAMLSLRFSHPSSLAALFLMLVFALAGCGAVSVESDNLAVIDVEFGQSFELMEGQKALVKNAGLTLHFEELISDSRCPVSKETTINCFWEGAIKAAFLFEEAGDPISLTFEGFVGDGSSALEQSASAYIVLLEGMEPYPEYETENDDAIVATLRIEQQ